MNVFRIDPEFKKLIPALAGDEYSQLEANIVADGCRDPLTVWEEEGLLLDGHNRFEICKRYGIEHETAYVSLDSRQHAINWIINNQLGRRNVTPEQASYLRGKRYNMEKADAYSRPGNDNAAKREDQNDLRVSTADRLADEFKVSAPTIKRDGKYAEAVDTLSDAIGDEARTTVLSGDSKVTKQDVADAAEWYKNTHQDTPILVANTEKEILEAANRIRYQKTEKRRSERKERNGKMCAEPPALSELPCRFDLVYADPPWRYEFNQTDSRVIENQYPTMALDDICNMPIGDITIENCVLFLWATFPKLEEAIQVVNAWGFKYRTAIVWDKVRMGQGIYTRQQTELLLIAIKGEMYKPESNYAGNFRSLVSIERSQNHSEKPKEFYNIIEGLYPDCTKIELFARNQREGWTSWGNQA